VGRSGRTYRRERQHHSRSSSHPRAGQACVRILRLSDEITTIEGLATTVETELHAMQSAWLEQDVGQCGYCRAGPVMAALAVVRGVHAEWREVGEADLDGLRSVCRCGTYPRIRAAIKAGAAGKSGESDGTTPA
jgi:aerobic-type carbon monoxide dehydrogenase small subunit (CoxS/CutS family)